MESLKETEKSLELELGFPLFQKGQVNEKQALTLPPFHVASHGPLPVHDAIFIQFHFVLSSACTCVFTDKIEPLQSWKEEHVLL